MFTTIGAYLSPVLSGYTDNSLPLPTTVTEYRFQQFFAEATKHFSSQRGVIEKVRIVVVTILLALCKVGLFFLNPSLTALGFVGGIVWKETATALDRIKLVWHNNYWLGWKPVFVTAGFFSLPAMVSIFAFLSAAELGSTHRPDLQDPEEHRKRKPKYLWV